MTETSTLDFDIESVLPSHTMSTRPPGQRSPWKFHVSPTHDISMFSFDTLKSTAEKLMKTSFISQTTSKTDIDVMKEKIGKKAALIISQREFILQLQEDNAQLKSALQDQFKQYAKLQFSVKTSETRSDTLKKVSVSNFEIKLKSVEDDIENILSTTNNAVDTLVNCQSRIDQLIASRTKILQDLKSIRKENYHLNLSNSDLKQEIERCEDSLQQISGDMQTHINNLGQKNEFYEEQIKGLKKTNKGLEKQVESLQNSNSDLTNENENLIKKKKKSKMKQHTVISDLQARITDLLHETNIYQEKFIRDMGTLEDENRYLKVKIIEGERERKEMENKIREEEEHGKIWEKRAEEQQNELQNVRKLLNETIQKQVEEAEIVVKEKEASKEEFTKLREKQQNLENENSVLVKKVAESSAEIREAQAQMIKLVKYMEWNDEKISSRAFEAAQELKEHTHQRDQQILLNEQLLCKCEVFNKNLNTEISTLKEENQLLNRILEEKEMEEKRMRGTMTCDLPATNQESELQDNDAELHPKAAIASELQQPNFESLTDTFQRNIEHTQSDFIAPTYPKLQLSQPYQEKPDSNDKLILERPSSKKRKRGMKSDSWQRISDESLKQAESGIRRSDRVKKKEKEQRERKERERKKRVNKGKGRGRTAKKVKKGNKTRSVKQAVPIDLFEDSAFS